MKYLLYFLFFFFLNPYGYSHSLLGRIIDQSRLPISNAYLYSSGSDAHCHSDEQGYFEFRGLQAGDTLYVSFLGYETIQRTLTAADFEEELSLMMVETAFDLEQVSVSNQRQAVSQVTAIDLQTNPVNSSQEILRRVPGLIIGQHAGGGKAEQIFLRGFDIDHGTDITISVDGLPVNMVSHAHGQGYADLHFLIPETIETIDFGKGPYYADQGNFNTAGYVAFRTKDRLAGSRVGLEAGEFNTARLFGLWDVWSSDQHNAYIATEYLLTDGPVESPQNFYRINLMGKYTYQSDEGDRLSVLLSHFESQWDASGQIPQRLVDAGTITRFGSVDDTEGGFTGRTNVALDYTKVLNRNRFVKTRAYYSRYDFELYSNFTFFLEDPENGDQIRQKETRDIYGVETKLIQNEALSFGNLEWQVGVGLRHDRIQGNELSRSKNRKLTLEQLALGDIDETNVYGFIDAALEVGRWRFQPALRFDGFKYNYVDQLANSFERSAVTAGIVSPKLTITHATGRNLQLFLKSGMGFHGNDTRVVVPQDGRQILPRAYGVDLGTVWKPRPRLWINAALWYLFLEQEFVYVGDAGIVEPSGKTRRQGVDLGVRWQLTKSLFFDADVNYTYARAIEEEEDNNFIPLAPDLTATGGLAFKHPSGFSAGLRYRYLKDRPANEDNSIVAEGFFILDANVSYRYKDITIGLSVENLLDQDWNEAQFATESRLQDESEPVEEIHFTPGVPLFIKGSIQYHFGS